MNIEIYIYIALTNVYVLYVHLTNHPQCSDCWRYGDMAKVTWSLLLKICLDLSDLFYGCVSVVMVILLLLLHQCFFVCQTNVMEMVRPLYRQTPLF